MKALGPAQRGPQHGTMLEHPETIRSCIFAYVSGLYFAATAIARAMCKDFAKDQVDAHACVERVLTHRRPVVTNFGYPGIRNVGDSELARFRWCTPFLAVVVIELPFSLSKEMSAHF